MKNELDEILGFDLLYAIQRGLNDSPGYPVAHIMSHKKGAICVTHDITNDRDAIKIRDKFDQFTEKFPDLCTKYHIPLLNKNETYVTRRSPPGMPNIIKYEFNISPENFHELMMAESENYVGYRFTGSFLRLANPTDELIKPGVICLFPILPLTDNTFIARTAGCNTTEILSTQMAFLIKNYLPEQASKTTSECYGHHAAPLVRETIPAMSHGLSSLALKCIGIEDSKDLYSQNSSGITELTIDDKNILSICDMTPKAINIYRALGNVTKEQLVELKSLEINAEGFLEFLVKLSKEDKREAFVEYLSAGKRYISFLETGVDPSPNNMHSPELANQFSKTRWEDSKKTDSNLKIMLETYRKHVKQDRPSDSFSQQLNLFAHSHSGGAVSSRENSEHGKKPR